MFLCLLRALKISRFMQGMPMESGATDRWKTGGRMKNASEIQPQFVVDEDRLDPPPTQDAIVANEGLRFIGIPC